MRRWILLLALGAWSFAIFAVETGERTYADPKKPTPVPTGDRALTAKPTPPPAPDAAPSPGKGFTPAPAKK